MKLSAYLDEQGRGAKARLSKAIGVHSTDLSDWLSGQRKVPPRHCAAIEQATDGRVTRRDLRPDDWQAYWPEQAALPS